MTWREYSCGRSYRGVIGHKTVAHVIRVRDGWYAILHHPTRLHVGTFDCLPTAQHECYEAYLRQALTRITEVNT